MAQKFPNLFSPLKIGSMTVRNRISMSAHHSGYDGLEAGLPGPKVVQYWEARAKGGIGMIGTQINLVHAVNERNPFLFPGAVDAYKRATDAVHAHGAKIVFQIGNLGGQFGGFGMPAPWAPSPVLTPNGKFELYCPHEMTRDEIKKMIDAHVHAAMLIKEAGADGVEIHGAHGYLISAFMSPLRNKRKDTYGETLENRMRFPIELTDAIRAGVGNDFVVGMRISGDEFTEGGYTLDDMLIMAPMLTNNGHLDFLNVSAGVYVTLSTIIDPMYYPPNSWVYLAAAIKQVVDVPVFARGRITDPVQAEQIIADNQADMVSIVGGNIADPEFSKKAREGREDEIRKCIGCREGCWGRVTRLQGLLAVTQGVQCAMNPVTGMEGEPGWAEMIPAHTQKKVMIIGGGPSGLETARVAALRGHQVSLFDKSPELGGLTLVAAKAPGRDNFLELGRYYTHELERLRVAVFLNTELTASMIMEKNPDAVVVATGSIPHIPDIPGIMGDNVVDIRQVLTGEVEIGDNVILIGDDDDTQSLDAACFLAEQGKQVEILCRGYYFGSKAEDLNRQAIHQRLAHAGVTLTPHTGVKEILGNTVITFNVFSGREVTYDAVDNVVIGCGSQEDNALYYELKDKVKELHLVGDANGIRRLHDMTMDGAMVGRIL
jgi:2,4-dienoyl-CoA reductase-like NADH-dependent reductase (Old Yellow Enzyme family)/thioredoxin reductase